MIDIGLADTLVGGLRSLLSPCSVSPLPAFFAYAFASPGRLLGRTGLCYPGLLTTLVPLGVLAAGLGAVLALIGCWPTAIAPAWAGATGRLRVGPWIAWAAAIVFVLAGPRHRPRTAGFPVGLARP